MRLAWYDSDGNLDVLPFDAADINNHAIAPDGNRVALQVAGEGARSEIWVYELDRRVAQRPTPGDVEADHPVWSPDGEWVYFSNGSQVESIYRIRADFSGAMEPLGDGTLTGAPQDASPDGSLLLVVTRTGSFDIGRRQVVSIDGGTGPVWSPDGETLYYLHDEVLLMKVSVTYEPSLRFGTPMEMFAMTASAGLPRSQVAVSRDGQRFMILTDQLGETIAGDASLERGKMHVLLNWGQVLRDRVRPGRPPASN